MKSSDQEIEVYADWQPGYMGERVPVKRDYFDTIEDARSTIEERCKTACTVRVSEVKVIEEYIWGKKRKLHKGGGDTMNSIKYKCTYTSLRGAACPVMFSKKYPSPLHCHAYDVTIWDINPNKTCEYCVQLSPDEVPKKKIWCDDMSNCDAYNDGGEDACNGCFAGDIVFDLDNFKEEE